MGLGQLWQDGLRKGKERQARRVTLGREAEWRGTAGKAGKAFIGMSRFGMSGMERQASFGMFRSGA